MTKRHLSFFVTLLLTVLTSALSCPKVICASGLAVSPAGLLIQYVKPGETYDITEVSGVSLRITNKDSVPHIISAHRPSAVGAKKWIAGYLEIPDPSWLKPDKEEIRIEANDTAKIRMSIEIPDEERYYNQNWSVSLLVRGKAEPGRMIALAAAPRFEIETEAKEGIKTRPDGLIAFEPHLIIIEGLVPGNKKEVKARLYNNDHKRHNYNIGSKIYPKDPKKSQISISSGYRWLPDPKWIKLNKMNASVEPKGEAKISFYINVPEDQIYFNQKWEAILFCEPEDGLSGFIRVHVETAKEQ